MVQRIIFLDVDGTLLDHEIVDPFAPAAIAQARKNGHLVFVCTGRSINGMDPEVAALDFDGWVTSGGAAARVGNELVQNLAMGAANVQRLMDYLDDNHIDYILEADDGVYCSASVKARFEAFWALRLKEHEAELQSLGLPPDTTEREKFLHFLPIEQADLNTINKVTFISRNADSYDLALAALGSDYHFVPGSIPMPGGSSGEIAASGITKATGISAVLQFLGRDAEDAIGIGDSWNDAEMFELCGVSVAMGNAPDGLKTLADFVTTPVIKGGVRDAFVKLGLI